MQCKATEPPTTQCKPAVVRTLQQARTALPENRQCKLELADLAVDLQPALWCVTALAALVLLALQWALEHLAFDMWFDVGSISSIACRLEDSSSRTFPSKDAGGHAHRFDVSKVREGAASSGRRSLSTVSWRREVSCKFLRYKARKRGSRSKAPEAPVLVSVVFSHLTQSLSLLSPSGFGKKHG